MPELPEVQTVINTLEKQIKNKTIEDIKVFYPKIIDNAEPDYFVNSLKGESFREFKRRGKFLIFYLDNYILVTHLRMEGKFFVENLPLITKHTHLEFDLSGGKYLLYHDVRKFGRMYIYKIDEEIECIKKLGLEPFDERLDVSYLKEHFNNKTVKENLLDQSIIAGIGNIYANEILYYASVHPEREFSSLTDEELTKIIEGSRTILKRAIELGGTTIHSFQSAKGIDGRFQLECKVQNKEGSICDRCGSTVKKIRVAGRGTYYCPGCQK